ncbi:acireductone synthase [Lysobacter sp. HDW10]|uniref:acireductone synthase n=1 Tax=Lysobacter sp. HDW10 TaxID=2714936 RepID=UPI00140813EC|nr:acireductone synthase [Lysobacter sp. HDW10]QIK81841.1 acireductone synthase [Lysobacter sp. HDW10]
MKPLVLTDIEGTTSSISFVKDVLFPYARQALPDFVARNGHDPHVRPLLDQVAAECGGICQDAMIAETLQGWIDEDRKHTALKALQGMIWAAGYREGDFKADIYPDVAPALQDWHARGIPIAVYSSGSVPAQKLLFSHTQAGDLTPLFCNYFDTEVGHKRVADSYRLIADTLDRTPDTIYFLSDVVEELNAAREAGMHTVLLDRLEDYPEPRSDSAANGHARVTSFADIALT